MDLLTDEQNSPLIIFENPKKETYYALVLTIGCMLLLTLIFVLRGEGAVPVDTWELDIVIRQSVNYMIIFVVPLLIAMFLRKAPPNSIGIQKKGFIDSLIVGAVFSCVIVYINLIFLITPIIFISWYFEEKSAKSKLIERLSNIIKSPGFKLAIFIISIAMITIYAFSGGINKTGEPVLSISAFYRLLATLVQAGTEEMLFRGFLLFRAVAWLGEKKGIILATGIFALLHFPMLVFNGMDIGSIGITLVFMFLWSIPLGYITHKSQNITGSTVIHVFSNLF